MRNKFQYLITAAAILTAAACRPSSDPMLVAAPSTLNFEAAGGNSKTIEVTSNILWNITDKPDWIDVSTYSEKGNAEVTVTAKANTTNAERKDKFFVTAATGSPSVKVDVIQKASTLVTVANRLIKGVTAPVAGMEPLTAIPKTTEYSGTVAWTPAASTFAYGTAYTAIITLTANEGYTLHGVEANSFEVEGATNATNAVNAGVITAQFPETAAAPGVISISEIDGVTAPVTGMEPVTDVTETDEFTGTVTWSPEVPEGGVFAGNKTYTATITLTPNAGYTLTGVPANFFTVDGAAATNAANKGVITAVFPETAEETTLSASKASLSFAAEGGSNAFEIMSNVNWTISGQPEWIDVSPVSGNGIATVTVDAKANTTADPRQGMLNISAATGSPSVMVSVTQDALKTVNIAAIGGIPAPVAGLMPVNAIAETAQYTGTVSWSPAVSGSFAYSTTYAATITLTPKEGFTFAGVPANFFTAAGATSVTNAVNSGTITAVFPATIETPGTEGNPFIVNSPATLQKVGSGTDGWTLDKYYRQTVNITLNGNWTPIGNNTTRFTGTYDGGGFSITGLQIATPYLSYTGLFGSIGLDGVVKNVALISVIIDGNLYVGGIAGNNNGTIENCYATGTIVGYSDVGGVAGSNANVIANCYTTCNVTGTNARIGGIAGYNSQLISRCYATGTISGTNYVGGINGESTYTVQCCVALNAQVTATTGLNVGRVTGASSFLFYNFARESGMTLKANNAVITTLTPTPNSTNIHGGDATAANTHQGRSDTWWSTSPDFSSASWSFAVNRLPYLKTTGGVIFPGQDPKVN